MAATCLLKRDNFLHSSSVRLWLCSRHSTSPLCCATAFAACLDAFLSLDHMGYKRRKPNSQVLRFMWQNRTGQLVADTPRDYRFHYFLLPKADHDLTAQCFLSHQPHCWLAVAVLCRKNLSCSHSSDSECHQAWCDAWRKGTSLSGKQSSFVQYT